MEEIVGKELAEAFKAELEKGFSLLNVENFHIYKQNLIKKYSIDYHTYDGYKKLDDLCSESLFYNYYADAQLVVVKNYFETRDNREYSDEEIIELVSSMKLKLWDKLVKYPMNNLSKEEMDRIYDDFIVLHKLYICCALKPNKEMHEMLFNPYKLDCSGIGGKYSAIVNIRTKAGMDCLGLQSYVDSYVPRVLETYPESRERMVLFR